MSAGLCACGQPISDCPHLGAFKSIEAKRAWFMDLDAAMAEIDTLGTRAEAKRAIEIAQLAAEKARQLPIGADVTAVLTLIGAALAKAAALVGLGA